MKNFFKFLILILVIANMLVLFVFDRFIPASIGLPFLSVEGLANVMEELSEEKTSEEEQKDLETEAENGDEAAEGEEDTGIQTGPEEPVNDMAEAEETESEEHEEVVPSCRIISDTGSNVRSGAGTGFPSIGIYPFDTVLTITGEAENGWYPVFAPDGTEGYIFESQIEILEAGAAAEGGEPAEGQIP